MRDIDQVRFDFEDGPGPLRPASDPPVRNRALFASLAVLAAVAVFLAPPLLRGETLLSFDERLFPPFVADAGLEPEPSPRQNLVTSDLQGWILPDTALTFERLAQGELPLWDSHELLGRPLHATGSFPTFYVPDWCYGWLEPVNGYAVSLALHLFWMGAGMMVLLRRRGLGWLASSFGGIALALSGWALVHLHIPHFVRSAAWLPWCLLASERLSDRPTLGRTAVLAAVVGGLALASFPPVMGIVLFATGLWALAGLLRKGPRLRVAASHALAITLGIGLAGVHLAPLVELRGDSMRDAYLSRELREQKSLAPFHLVSLAVPDFQGNPVLMHEAGFPTVERDHPIARELFGEDVQDNYVENTLYPGIAALALALLALVTGFRRASVLTFLALAGCGLVLAFSGPAQDLAARGLIPGFGAGSPKRALLLLAFALPALSAFGFQLLVDGKGRVRAHFLTVCLALLAAVLLGWMETSDWLSGLEEGGSTSEAITDQINRAFLIPAAVALLVGLTVFLFHQGPVRGALALSVLLVADLCWFGWTFNPPQPRAALGAATPSVEFLQGVQGRTLRFPTNRLLGASLATRFGVHSVGGMQPLVIREVCELLDAFHPGVIVAEDPWWVGDFHDHNRLSLPLLNLLARYVISSVEGLEALGFEKRAGSVEEQMYVYENPRALPAAFFCATVEVLEDRDARLERLVSPEFDPGSIAILERTPPGPITASPAAAPAQVTVRRPGPECIEVDVNTAAAGALVVNEAFHSGWRLELNGQEQEPERIDHALLGALVEAGQHQLVFRYRPGSVRLGAAISLACAALIGLLAVRGLLAVKGSSRGRK